MVQRNILASTTVVPDLYLTDTYQFEAKTRVVATGRVEGRKWVMTEENLFHPQGGGQPADRGWVDDLVVTPRRHEETGSVIAVATVDGELEDVGEGQAVAVRVDRDARLLHAALHTAGHLVEAVGRLRGWSWVPHSHFPGQARIDFSAPAPVPELADVTGRDLLVAELQGALDQAVKAALPVRAEVEPGGRRVVWLGELHCAPCGGTHVRNLADLADATVTGVKLKKGIIRVSYAAQHGPLQ